MNAPAGIQERTPAWAGEEPAQVSGAGSGASPAHTATAQYTYEMPYRRCIKRNCMTYPIALCLRCKKLVKPVRSELSKTGAHGMLYFAHRHPLAFVVLEQTNSGKRSVHFVGEVPEDLVWKVRIAWVDYGTDVNFVKNLVDEWLYLAKEGCGREKDLTIVEVDGKVGLVEAGDW